MFERIIHEHVLQELERESATALSRQLYLIFSRLVLNGVLGAGTKLPSSRALAQELGVSRNTVIIAYEQLMAEGYVETRSGSGTFVSETVPDMSSQVFARAPSLEALREQPILSARGSVLVDEAQATEQQWGAFVPGVPDVTLFPHQRWLRLLRRYWRAPQPDFLTYAHGAGHLPLRQALCEHLRLMRSVRCQPEQVLITGGIHQSLRLISLMLADEKEQVWMEDPGYWGASSVLRSSGLQLEPIPVDEEGLSPTVEQAQQPPKLIFVTPSHQYPLGHVMSLSRRRMLLEYAHQHGVWIIEDDYDSEFRFSGRPIASLQGLDEHGRVLYLGTFSKTLFPSLRLGFMVVPKVLAHLMAVGLSELYREGRLVEQAALADFIAQGEYAAHIRKMRGVYARRQMLLRTAIERHFGADWPLSTEQAGLHLVMHLPAAVDDVLLCRQAFAELGVWVRPLSNYFFGAQKQSGLLFGYAAVPDEQIGPVFDCLAKMIKQACASYL